MKTLSDRKTTHNHKFAPFGLLWTFWAYRFLLFLRHDEQPFGPKSQTDANLPTLPATLNDDTTNNK